MGIIETIASFASVIQTFFGFLGSKKERTIAKLIDDIDQINKRIENIRKLDNSLFEFEEYINKPRRAAKIKDLKLNFRKELAEEIKRFEQNKKERTKLIATLAKEKD